MSIRVFDFECAAGHRNEMFVESDVHSMQCLTCGKIARRLLAAPRSKLDPLSGDFPGATMKWEANRESHMAKERKTKDKHGSWT